MDLIERVLDGEVPLHRIEEHCDDPDDAADVRRRVVARLTGSDPDRVGEMAFDAGRATERNVENLVGATHLPLGVAGPLPVSGGAADDEYVVPLATTEGALVASVNRGCSALAAAGGVESVVIEEAMTRAPVFRVDGVTEAERTVDWVEAHRDALAEAAEATTSHGELLDVEPYVVGTNVFLRFGYDTKDAMGMNMATVATEAAAEVVEEETPAELVALSGNLCADKKPAAINLVEGRGRSVVAEAVLSEDVLEERLNASPGAMLEVHDRKTVVGSTKAGTLGANAHAANVVAAVFLATGQDAAQVVEASSAITSFEPHADGLHVSVSIPALELGTVGGGTGLATQREALEMLGVAGGGDPAGSHARELSEVVAGAVLAGELSLHAALASDDLGSSHEELGRG
jgi:hydroxymethylglutaryl-CoA reductase (NADPH)